MSTTVTDFRCELEQFSVHQCQSCLKRWRPAELDPIEAIECRIAPGEQVPSGQCPECSALCHEIGVRVPGVAAS